MNKKLLGLLLALCMAASQATALTPAEKARLLFSNLGKIAKDGFFGIETNDVHYKDEIVRVHGSSGDTHSTNHRTTSGPTHSQPLHVSVPPTAESSSTTPAVPAPSRLQLSQSSRPNRQPSHRQTGNIAKLGQQLRRLTSTISDLSTKTRLNPSTVIPLASCANDMIPMVLSSLAAKAIQGKYAPKELLKAAGFSATGAIINTLIGTSSLKLESTPFFRTHKNLNTLQKTLTFFAFVISLFAAQNPELAASAIAEIKEKGFVTASGEFFENAFNGFSENGSRADRIAFAVRNVTLLITALMKLNFSEEYLADYILPTEEQ
jgi:hypothetical protein